MSFSGSGTEAGARARKQGAQARKQELPVRDQQAGPDRFRGQNAEKVEIGGLFVLEEAHFVPGPARGAEYLVPGGRLDQAQGAVDLLADRVRGGRDGRKGR